MSAINEYDFVASEITELEQLLGMISPDRVIDRLGLESRLTDAKATLTTLHHSKPTMCLTFKGKPVVGTRSISADFGAKALEAFSDVYVAVTAGANTDISLRGRIPEKEKNMLRIVGTAIGSFGFELEPPQEIADLFASPEDTIRQIESLLSISAIGNDDEITEIVADLSPRTIQQLHKFLDVLVNNESWCGLSYGNRKFDYANLEQVRTSAKRLANDNVHNSVENLQGTFTGFFPIGRTFEFLPEVEQKGVIHGKIDVNFHSPNMLNQKWLDKPVSVLLHRMQIGHGQPRYTLKTIDDIKDKKK